MKIRIPASEYCTNCSYRTEPAKPENGAKALNPGETARWCKTCQILIYTTK